MSDENIYAAPESSELINQEGEHIPLTLKQKLWGFQGRISRAGYWGYMYSWGLLASIPFLIPYVFIIIHLINLENNGGEINIPLMVTLGLLCFILYIPAAWMSFAIMIKRYHDRGKSGWWSLILLVPYVGAIWLLVDCGCLAGQQGRNQYGDDPLLADGKTHA